MWYEQLLLTSGIFGVNWRHPSLLPARYYDAVRAPTKIRHRYAFRVNRPARSVGIPSEAALYEPPYHELHLCRSGRAMASRSNPATADSSGTHGAAVEPVSQNHAAYQDMLTRVCPRFRPQIVYGSVSGEFG